MTTRLLPMVLGATFSLPLLMAGAAQAEVSTP
ncbi:MAG: hypothetical protein ACI9U2_003124, partial [Bradymonadia bacterium]